MAKVLIIDDDEAVCLMLAALVEEIGENAEYSLTLNTGINKALSSNVDVVLLDVRMPDGNGLEAITRIRSADSPPEVIIITGDGTADGAELAMKSGAWDYLQKPLSPKRVILPLKRVIQYRENTRHLSKPSFKFNRAEIIGSSPRLQASLDKLAAAAKSQASVLILGESGTGKELFARALHKNSNRAHKQLVTIDCTALPKTLVESYLFGYAKGAFTGADRDQEGLIYLAHGSTLFLDEIGELPLTIQKSFLRVLQEKRYRPVGSKREINSDFRLVCATNRNLETMVLKKTFREDLLFRIRTIAIELPPLRERPEDIPPIALHYLEKLSRHYVTQPKKFSKDFIDMLQSYDWPGNVRELIHNLEQAIISSGEEPILYPKHLSTHIRVQLARSAVRPDPDSPVISFVSGATDGSTGNESLPPLKEYRENAIGEIEKNYMIKLMKITNGDTREACRISKLSRSRLYSLLKKYSIKRQY